MARDYTMNQYEKQATSMYFEFYTLVLAVFKLISPSHKWCLHLAWLSYAAHMLH